MADLNKVMLIWRIASDLDIKKMWESGISVLNFSLATNRSYKNKSGEKIEEAEFHRCVVFGTLADMMGQYLSKWRKIFVEWRLRTRQWEDQSWNKRYTTEIIVTDMNFCDNKTNNTKTNIDNDINKEELEEDIPF